MSLYIIIPILICYFLFSYFFEFYRLKIARNQLEEIRSFLENWELRFIENLYVEINDMRVTRHYSTVFRNIKNNILNNHRNSLLIGKPTIFKTDFFESNAINKELFSKNRKVFKTDNNLEKTVYLLPEMIRIGEEHLSKIKKPEIVESSRKDYDEDKEECKRLRKKVKKKLDKGYIPKNGNSIRKLLIFKPKWLTKQELLEYSDLLFEIKEQLKTCKAVILENEIIEFHKKLNSKYSSYFEKERKLKEYLTEQDLAEAYEKILYRFISLRANLNEESEKEDMKAFSKKIDFLEDNCSLEDLKNWERNNDFLKTIANNGSSQITGITENV